VIVVTCEHAVNRVPARYASLFASSGRLLQTHRAYDRGALELARVLSQQLDATLFSATATRLLVDLNRSPRNGTMLSRFTRALDAPSRRALLDRYYYPYRLRVESLVADAVKSGPPVCHVSVHSFTPVLRGSVRRADVGLLYDPNRHLEVELCLDVQRALRQIRSDLVVRRNYPYRGTTDGMTSYLRKCFGPQQYVGIELEINQRWPRQGGRAWRAYQQDVIRALAEQLPK
jgi:predicted N-formylglutamate amidohydrolase